MFLATIPENNFNQKKGIEKADIVKKCIFRYLNIPLTKNKGIFLYRLS
jgi:hypothetical protein